MTQDRLSWVLVLGMGHGVFCVCVSSVSWGLLCFCVFWVFLDSCFDFGSIGLWACLESLDSTLDSRALESRV